MEDAFKVQIERLVPTIFYKYPRIQKIVLMADAVFTDKCGQKSTGRAMVASFTRKNAASINWGEVHLDDLPELADAFSNIRELSASGRFAARLAKRHPAFTNKETIMKRTEAIDLLK